MQRTKQQALMFLLGAALVGSAVGFSAAGYMGHEQFASQYGPRTRFYDELGLSTQQRATLDSMSFQQDCAVREVLASKQSVLDSMKAHFRAQQDSVFTPAQRARLELRRKEIKARRDAEQAKEQKKTCAGN